MEPGGIQERHSSEALVGVQNDTVEPVPGALVGATNGRRSRRHSGATAYFRLMTMVAMMMTMMSLVEMMMMVLKKGMHVIVHCTMCSKSGE